MTCASVGVGVGVSVRCLPLGGADLARPADKMAIGVIAAMVELERDFFTTRQTIIGMRKKHDRERVAFV